MATANLNGLEPYTWLKDTLEKLPSWPYSRIDELLPDQNFKGLICRPERQSGRTLTESDLQNSHSTSDNQRTWFVVIGDSVSAR